MGDASRHLPFLTNTYYRTTEECVESLYRRRILTAVGGRAGDKHPRRAVKSPRDQLRHQQGRGIVSPPEGADVLPFAADEPAAHVIARIAEIDVHVVSHFPGGSKGMFDQNLSQLMPLKRRVDAQGTAGDDFLSPAVLVLQPGLGVHDVADDPAVQLQHEGKLRNEIGMGTHLMHEIMLIGSRLVYVPKRLAGQFLHRPVVLFRLRPDHHVILHFPSPSISFWVRSKCSSSSDVTAPLSSAPS